MNNETEKSIFNKRRIIGFIAADFRRIAMAALVLSMSGAGIAGLLSAALLTDAETSADNTFSTGTVNLTLNPTTSRFTVTDMVPGDVYTAPITVGNAGSQQLRYSMLSTTDENLLAAQLEMSIKVGSATTGCDNAGFATYGAQLTPPYTAGVLGTTTGTKVMGDAAQGSHAGDRVLAPATNEVLCIRVTLPGTVTTPAAASTSADFLFNAEQTLNNP